jgi:pullulanase
MRILVFTLLLFTLNSCMENNSMPTPVTELGFHYTPARTTFKTVATNAEKVMVHLYDQPDSGTPVTYQMQPEGELWQRVVDGDLLGKYYTLQVVRDSVDSREFIDPWSRSNTNTYGRGLIFTDNTPIAASPKLSRKTDAIIYEVHVRDFSIAPNSGINAKGKFLGFTEKGTRLSTDSAIKTGIDHLVELGVNVVQLLPVQDFDNDETNPTYNWGYMPMNFNSPDGWYASDLTDASRVIELKKLVSALHEADIKVTLDVVYNHTAENKDLNPWAFESLAPGEYYRYTLDGGYWNGSACGNEFKSEGRLGRDFIVQSTKYFVEEFDIDGYRFDLMGLIDLETMQEVVKTLRTIKPDILIYGEPWTAAATPIEPTVKGVQKGQGFAVFNDHFRDGVKGSVFDHGPGFVQTGINIDRVKAGIKGSIDDFALNPDETLNSVEAHDNHTLWDRLIVSTKGQSDADRIRMHKMSAVLVLTAQGIPFIHAGQEFMRSKFGNENSYNAPDSINMMRWDLKKTYNDVFQYHQGLIALRKAHHLFRFATAEQVRRNLRFFDDDLNIPLPDKVVAWQIKAGVSPETWSEAVVIVNAEDKDVTVALPEGDFHLYANAEIASVKPILAETIIGKILVERKSAVILGQQWARPKKQK